MNRFTTYMTAVLPALGLTVATGCTIDNREQPVTDDTMRLFSGINSTGSEDATGAVFLFWDFGDWLSHAADPVPLHVKYPDGDINDYSRPGSPYNTDELYPDGNLRVVATGYAPSSLAPKQREDGTFNYEILIPKDGGGLCDTDVLTSVRPIVASASLPFDRADGDTLLFMHAQSQVIFKAKLAEDMGKFIQKVRIKLDQPIVGTRVIWSRDKSIYGIKSEQEDIATGTDGTYTIEQQGDDLLSKEYIVDIGSAYIVPGQTSLNVLITVERSDDVEFTSYEEVSFSAQLPFEISRNHADSEDIDVDGSMKTENTLYANESYTFTLVFGEESIELTGNRCEWENGGYLIVPIYPTVN